ncbi:MAG: T9SS type A sorting domain-containing protein [Candidatus Kapaibacterium sp.]
MALLSVGSISAQTPMHYNYDTQVGSNNFPFSVVAGKVTQFLILPGELNQPTPAPSGMITTFWVFCKTATITYTNLTIKMKQDIITTLPTGVFYTDPMDTVYFNPSVVLNSVNGAFTPIVLNTPFAYDNTKSLIVEISQCGASATGMSTYNTSMTGTLRRTYNQTAGGCNYIYQGQGSQIMHCGIDVSTGPVIFFDNFESYTIGQRLACQDSLNWTTWSIAPCNTTEDPLISSAQSFSPTKSVVITQNNDLVKRYGNDTTGIHEITFKFYVPTGKAGYWNTLATFAGASSQWGMECYFDVAATGNNGRILGGSSTAVPFAYTHDAWQTVNLLVNLNVDSAKFVINGNLIHKWRWTAGASGTAVPKRIAASDFFGATATDEMYMDNFSYNANASWIITGVTQNGNIVPAEYALSQNYPNPFNPVTKINYSLPKNGFVTLKVYNVLGVEVANLVNENKAAGNYSVDFNASEFTSGIYFYSLNVNGFTETKRMMLIK